MLSTKNRPNKYSVSFCFAMSYSPLCLVHFCGVQCEFFGVFKEGEDMEPIMEQDVVLSRIICCYICCAYV